MKILHFFKRLMMPRETTPILVVLGATGAGKSKLALELAQKFSGEIISADAMQMYKGLDIITNKVTHEERLAVKHHLIDFLDPLTTCNVIDFRNAALPIIDNLLQNKKIPVICGGTNYYIESLLWKILVSNDNSHRETASKRIKLEESSVPVTLELYKRLQEVDPERAAELHPNERRKIMRSLEVYDTMKRKHSEIIAEQQTQQGGGFLGGPLRYSNVVVFWVQCDQTVLEERCDKRVDKMIERGMVEELEKFHSEYNSKRDHPDYTVGIFQSIGFKEFHEYLVLDEEEKKSERGRKLFDGGVQQLKLVTRQYARKQVRWIRNRFLNPKRSCPPVYAFDSTNPEKWNEAAYSPAVRVLDALMVKEIPSQQPLPLTSPKKVGYEEKQKLFHCPSCDLYVKGSLQYDAHIRSRKHHNILKRAKKMKKLSDSDKARSEIEQLTDNNLQKESTHKND